jgi:excisionase family DNA binding protein
MTKGTQGMTDRPNNIRDTEFFTTAELAKKLKMNVQVITRKVQAGEILAYKIGKDWRIPDTSVTDWLETKTNRRSDKEQRQKAKQTAQKSKSSKRSAKPSAPSNRTHLLEYLLAHFEPNRAYTQDEVDRVIGRHHDDAHNLRNELVECQMMDNDGDTYHRRRDYQLSH